jgi:single-strand DNA-binding protein
MTDNITVIGVVGGDPRVHTTSQGLPITSFRLASTRRFFDRVKGTWENGETNWYTISTFRQLAKNVAASIHRGERVVVHGRLRIRAWESGEKSGTAIEIEADSVGHDLNWATTSLTKNPPGSTTGTVADGAAESSASEGAVTGWAAPLGVETTEGSGHEGLDPDTSDAGADGDPDLVREPAHVPF